MPVSIEQPQRVVLLEVLPLQDGVGIDLADRLDEGLDESVVAGAAQPRLRVAEVERVIEQALVVGAAVQRHRQGQRRVHARAGAVQCQLADRDAHPARALIAQAEDPLVVGGNDQPDPFSSGVVQQLRDPVDVLGSDPQASRPAQDVAEPAAGLADCRGVDDRREFFQMVHEQPVKDRLVAVLQRLQADVLLQVGRLGTQVLQLQGNLLIDRRAAPGKQAAQPERDPFAIGKRCVLVQQRLAQDPRTAVTPVRIRNTMRDGWHAVLPGLGSGRIRRLNPADPGRALPAQGRRSPARQPIRPWVSLRPPGRRNLAPRSDFGRATNAAIALEVSDLQREDGRSRSRLPQHHAQRQLGSP